MDKTYIGPQADADVGPITLPSSARSRPAVGVLAGLLVKPLTQFRTNDCSNSRTTNWLQYLEKTLNNCEPRARHLDLMIDSTVTWHDLVTDPTVTFCRHFVEFRAPH